MPLTIAAHKITFTQAPLYGVSVHDPVTGEHFLSRADTIAQATAQAKDWLKNQLTRAGVASVRFLWATLDGLPSQATLDAEQFRVTPSGFIQVEIQDQDPPVSPQPVEWNEPEPEPTING